MASKARKLADVVESLRAQKPYLERRARVAALVEALRGLAASGVYQSEAARRVRKPQRYVAKLARRYGVVFPKFARAAEGAKACRPTEGAERRHRFTPEDREASARTRRARRAGEGLVGPEPAPETLAQKRARALAAACVRAGLTP